jgi:hypothetical protein
MYVESFAQKVTTALQANAVVDHSTLIQNLSHQESLGVIDTLREMERRGQLRRELQRGEDGKLVLRYVRVG